MKHYSFTPRGVCTKRMDITLEDDRIVEVSFTGGCSGNTQGIAALLQNMNVTDAINRLEGIRCGFRNTSCPDQLAKALREAAKAEN